MHQVTSARDLRSTLSGETEIGFVPTMGYLHAGHASLIRRARADSKVVVASIFVNPKQFGPNEDFERYPRDLQRDRALCEAAGVDLLWVPEAQELYPPGFATSVQVDRALTDRLCGAFRPGHFDGVTTIVAMLLNHVGPRRAYFGQKDLQQWRVIAQMVRDLGLATEIVRCPTVREEDGLALSSRNMYLSATDRQNARKLSRALGMLVAGADLATARASLAGIPDLALQYLEVVALDTLEATGARDSDSAAVIAATVGHTRLIDNAILDPRGPDASLADLSRETHP